jgi:hypothetical protein
VPWRFLPVQIENGHVSFPPIAEFALRTKRHIFTTGRRVLERPWAW